MYSGPKWWTRRRRQRRVTGAQFAERIAKAFVDAGVKVVRTADFSESRGATRRYVVTHPTPQVAYVKWLAVLNGRYSRFDSLVIGYANGSESRHVGYIRAQEAVERILATPPSDCPAGGPPPTTTARDKEDR